MACVTSVLLVALIITWLIVLSQPSLYSFIHCSTLQSLFSARMMTTLTWIHCKAMAAKVVVTGHHLSASASKLMRRWLHIIITSSSISSLDWVATGWRNIINLTIFFNLCRHALSTLRRNQAGYDFLCNILGGRSK